MKIKRGVFSTRKRDWGTVDKSIINKCPMSKSKLQMTQQVSLVTYYLTGLLVSLIHCTDYPQSNANNDRTIYLTKSDTKCTIKCCSFSIFYPQCFLSFLIQKINFVEKRNESVFVDYLSNFFWRFASATRPWMGMNSAVKDKDTTANSKREQQRQQTVQT